MSEPVLLNPVPHCLTQSFHCLVLSLDEALCVAVIGRWQVFQARAAVSSWGFCEWTQSSGASGRWFFFFNEAHELIYFPSLCHIKKMCFYLVQKILFKFFFATHAVSDKVLLPRDVLLKTVALVKHTDTRPGQNSTDTFQSFRFTSLLMKNSGVHFKYLKSTGAAWFCFMPIPRTVQVSEMNWHLE